MSATIKIIRKKVNVMYYVCNKCEYAWEPRKDVPKQCPGCKRMIEMEGEK